MTHTRRAAVAAPILVLALTLGACAGRAGGAVPSATGTPTPTPTSTGPAQPAEIAVWTAYAGIAPELVHVTDIDGFELWPQFVGVIGDDGMSVGYGTADGSSVLLRIDRFVDPSAVPCAELPDTSEPLLRCSVMRGDAQVVLEGDGVEPAVLRAAAEAVRVPRLDELAALFAEVATPRPLTERPDLEQGGELPHEDDSTMPGG